MYNKKNYKKYTKITLLLLNSAALFFTTSNASDLNIPNTFVANTPAVAADVNENFNAVETSVDDNNSRLIALEALIITMQTSITNLQSVNSSQQTTINQLQSDLTAVENNTVLELDGLLQYALIDGHDTAEFTGVNVQINNGSGATTGSVNAKGNLIIGYHPSSGSAKFFCSDPQYSTQIDCENNTEIWDSNVRTGSHNLILGRGHSYTGYSGIIAGNENISNGNYASVLGGVSNIASSSFYSIVLAGQGNIASGGNSSISGGLYNTASGFGSSVSGGKDNTASGSYSNVSGGQNNFATSTYSSVSAGEFNVAAGFHSNVSGGEFNVASGISSSVTGGRNNTASGNYSTVSGGDGRQATGTNDWVAGSLFENN